MSETTTPAPGTPEHDAAMAAKFETQQTTETPAQKPERPAHIPEKFWDAEKGEVRLDDLAKSYAELEKARTEKKPDEQTTEKVEGGEKSSEEQAKEQLADKGLDFDAFSKEFTESGKLGEESYKKLADAGIPKEMVDAFVEGQVAKARAIEFEVKSAVGGDKAFNEMAEWYGKSATDAELNAYNAAMDSGDINQMRLAVTALQAKFEASRGKEPSLVNGGVSGPTGDAFRSTAELTAAMRDPRYAKDPAYRADVAERLRNSNIM